MPTDWIWVALLILVSPAVGSFLGVLVDRLPAGQDVLAAQSRCAACGSRLAWRDMVPIVTRLRLGGRCRSCGAGIPGHLLRIEIAALASSLAAVALVPDAGVMWLGAAYLWCLIALFYSDLLHLRLPDVLTAALLALGLWLALLDPARGLAEAVLSAAAASGAFLLMRYAYQALRRREGLGLGDVKIMAGIAAGLGWQAVPFVVLVAALMALAVIALQALAARTLPAGDARVPFGSYLAAAAGLLFFV